MISPSSIVLQSPASSPPPAPVLDTPSAINITYIEAALRNVMEANKSGYILSSFQLLRDTTEIVVLNCEQLGLTTDDSSANINREDFWHSLNNCWLHALSRSMAAETVDQRLHERDFLFLRQSVIVWANMLERHGLVDYEMGWWETDILKAIEGSLRKIKICGTPSMDDSTCSDLGSIEDSQASPLTSTDSLVDDDGFGRFPDAVGMNTMEGGFSDTDAL